MRIGFDARMIEWGGVGTYSKNLLKALSGIDAQNEYVLFCYPETAELILEAPNFTKKLVKQPVFSLFRQFGWINDLKEANLDIFHSPHFVFPPVIPCPSVVTIHDLIPLIIPAVMPSRGDRFYYKRANRSALEKVKGIIAVSECTKRDIIRFFGTPEEKIRVIYEAAAPEFREIKDESLLKIVLDKYGLQRPFILNVGNPKPHKNWVGLLKAFAGLKKKGFDHKLVLIGPEDPRFLEPKSLVEQFGMEKDVLFPGFVEKEDLPMLYNAADVLVFPSFYEGFGLPPLEAMACGTPVVCSNAASLLEVAGDAVLMVDPNDVRGLAAAISDVISDESLRKSLKEKGLARAAQFSWQRTAEQTLEIYNGISK
ncbi:MAG: glycosyltransferase family 1 protein [Actinomycetota bacterium]|nr:glycosyltransferase family 1 protein [Actinomycetota bacterium]